MATGKPKTARHIFRQSLPVISPRWAKTPCTHSRRDSSCDDRLSISTFESPHGQSALCRVRPVNTDDGVQDVMLVYFTLCTFYSLPSQANKGVAFSENKARKRTKCVHTLLVALALWREGGMGTEGLDVGGDMSGEEGGDEGDDGEDPGGASCQHTAQILLDNDGKKYARDLANSFNFMSIYKLPPSLPGGVMSVKATNGVTYTTSQQKCSTCRGCFSPAGVVEAAKLVTRVSPRIRNGCLN